MLCPTNVVNNVNILIDISIIDIQVIDDTFSRCDLLISYSSQ